MTPNAERSTFRNWPTRAAVASISAIAWAASPTPLARLPMSFATSTRSATILKMGKRRGLFELFGSGSRDLTPSSGPEKDIGQGSPPLQIDPQDGSPGELLTRFTQNKKFNPKVKRETGEYIDSPVSLFTLGFWQLFFVKLSDHSIPGWNDERHIAVSPELAGKPDWRVCVRGKTFIAEVDPAVDLPIVRSLNLFGR